MARFIRGKVKAGQYTNASEVVRDAVRQMQDIDTAKRDRMWLADFESRLPESQRQDIVLGVRRGIEDMQSGRFEKFDADRLRRLAKPAP